MIEQAWRDGIYQYSRAVAGLVLPIILHLQAVSLAGGQGDIGAVVPQLGRVVLQSSMTCTPLTHNRTPSLVRVEIR